MQLTHLCSCRKLGYVRISTFILVTQLATFLCNYKEHKLTLLTKIKTGNFFRSISISFDLTPCFQVYSFAIFHYQLAETKSWELLLWFWMMFYHCNYLALSWCLFITLEKFREKNCMFRHAINVRCLYFSKFLPKLTSSKKNWIISAGEHL